MSIGVVLALGAMSAAAIADLVYRVAQVRGIANPVTFLFYQSTVFTITVWTIAVLTGQIQEINTPAWVFGLPAGLISYIGLLLFVMSLREGTASINAPIFRLSFVVTAAGAIIFLGESVSLPKVVGILLAIVAVFFLADLRALNTAHNARFRSMYLLLPGMILFGIAGVLNAEATNQGSKTIPLIMTGTISFGGAAFVHMLATRQVRPDGTTVRLAPFVGLLQLAWAGLLIQSLQTGDASISFPIAQLSFVATAILAVVFLKEAAGKRLVLGLSTATFSVMVFAFA